MDAWMRAFSPGGEVDRSMSSSQVRAHVHVTTLPLSDREELRASTDPFLYFPTATPPGENARIHASMHPQRLSC